VWAGIATARTRQLDQLDNALGDTPRVEAVAATQVQEPLDASGDVDVRARALLAGGKGLPQDAPFDGSMLGGHDWVGGTPSCSAYS